MPILETHQLTKHYGASVGIDGLNLALSRGEILGFLGPNGAGKTTTIRLLLGLLRPSAGSFALFGESISWGMWRHRARLGFLPGDLRLPRRMTGERLLQFLAHLHPVIDHGWVHALAERLEFDLTRRIRALSRGNLQKLGILQALMHRPELVILDEPTTALDPLVQRTLLEILRDLAESGSAVFFSSHHIPEVEKICHRVAIVREGRLVAVEEIASLRRHLIARVTLRLSADAVAPPWQTVAGVLASEQIGRDVVLTVRGEPGPLLRELAGLPVEQITWQPASLEDHFFSHYGSPE